MDAILPFDFYPRLFNSMCNYFYKQEMQDVRELSFSKSGLYQMELPCNNDDSTLDLEASKIIFQNITYKISNFKYTLYTSFNHFVFCHLSLAGQWQLKFFCNST